MRLSEHFELSELTKSSTALRHGINNTPNAEQIENLKLLCEKILEPVRANYHRSITPSSGFRCIELNRLVGSNDNSQHTKGQAVDFEILGVDNKHLFDWICDNLEFDQLIAEFYKSGIPDSGWLHCSYLRCGNRQRAFDIKD